MNKLIIGLFLVGLVLIFGCKQEEINQQALDDLETERIAEDERIREEVEKVQMEEFEKEMENHMGEEIIEEMEEMMGEEPKSSIKDFTITAKQWEFVPSTITVNEGDTVKLTITSTDVTHGFRLPDFGINERLEPGTTVNVEFTADKKGAFTFSCSVPCGSGHSRMSGTLIVN